MVVEFESKQGLCEFLLFEVGEVRKFYLRLLCRLSKYIIMRYFVG